MESSHDGGRSLVAGNWLTKLGRILSTGGLSLIFERCVHANVRCIHGDEINSTIRAWRKPTLARVRCRDCGRALYDVWPMPDPCFYTGEPHTKVEV